jgi:hypothetical protein
MKATCSSRAVVEDVVTTVTRLVESWKTAEQQFSACFDQEVASGAVCSKLPLKELRDACAATACTARGFVDVLMSVVEVVDHIVEHVTKEVVVCAGAVLQRLPNLFNLPTVPLAGLEKPGAAAAKTPSIDDIRQTLDVLTSATDALGPFARALLGGTWRIAALPTPIRMSDGNLAIPYGIEVDVPARLAAPLTVTAVGTELVTSWGAALTLLAAVSPEFLAIVGPLGIVVPAAVSTSLAALGATLAPVAAIILAFVLLALIYGTAIVAGITAAEALGALKDGKVTIWHPTFALAAVKLMTIGIAPSELMPPIVLG